MHFLDALGSGACASALHRRTEACPYSPDFPLFAVFYPACCDGAGCGCECISQCAGEDDVRDVLGRSVLDFEFAECSTELRSEEEAVQWRTEKCSNEGLTGRFKSCRCL